MAGIDVTIEILSPIHLMIILPAEDYQNFCAEWKYLQTTYPEIFTAADVLNSCTSIRYQTKLENGIAADGSLHNMRTLDEGTK